MLSCFLTMGHTYASIQAAQEIVSCCKSSSEKKDCCKNKISLNSGCDKNAPCTNLIPSLILFSEINSDINKQYFHFTPKNQPDTWLQKHFSSPFLDVWTPPQIG